MRRRVWLTILALIVLMIAGDWVYWGIATHRLRQTLVQWEQGLRGDGWDVGSGPVSNSGWPLAARVSVANLTLRHGAGRG